MYEIVDRDDPRGVSYGFFQMKGKGANAKVQTVHTFRSIKTAQTFIQTLAHNKRRKPETFAIRNAKTLQIVA